MSKMLISVFLLKKLASLTHTKLHLAMWGINCLTLVERKSVDFSHLLVSLKFSQNSCLSSCLSFLILLSIASFDR